MNWGERLVKRSRLELAGGLVGDNAAVPISLVVGGRGDPRDICVEAVIVYTQSV